MSTYVLVPGHWLGAWAWQGVTEPLRAAGHTVHPLTLTGLADISHLASPQVDLDTHIEDIVRLILAEELYDVVLVGHSGAAAAVTGAADRVPGRLSRVVYLESGPLPDGMSQLDVDREFVEPRLVDGWRYPMPSWPELERSGCSLAGLGAAELERVRERATDQPGGTLAQPLRLTGGAEKLPKTLISCSFPLAQVRELAEAGHPLFAPLTGPEWELVELPTGHWPMFSRPEATAGVLASVQG